MSHVKIRPAGSGAYSLEIDGHDIAHAVAADGISIDFVYPERRKFSDGPVPKVTITLAEGVDLDLDLPDALADLIVQPERDDEERQ